MKNENIVYYSDLKYLRKMYKFLKKSNLNKNQAFELTELKYKFRLWGEDLFKSITDDAKDKKLFLKMMKDNNIFIFFN